jgi:hypothetical protein
LENDHISDRGRASIQTDTDLSLRGAAMTP